MKERKVLFLRNEYTTGFNFSNRNYFQYLYLIHFKPAISLFQLSKYHKLETRQEWENFPGDSLISEDGKKLSVEQNYNKNKRSYIFIIFIVFEIRVAKF